MAANQSIIDQEYYSGGGVLGSQKLEYSGNYVQGRTPYASASSLDTPSTMPRLSTTPLHNSFPSMHIRSFPVEEEAVSVKFTSLPPPQPPPVQQQKQQHWASPVERAAIAMSRKRANTRMKPNLLYVLLSCVQLGIGVAVLGLGGAAFATTPTFNAGCFWAGLVILIFSLYSFTLLGLKLNHHKNKIFKRLKRFLYYLLLILCVLCILTTISATAIDMMSAYLIHRIDFSRCLHTEKSISVDCDSKTCPYLRLAPNTCYCCYIYHQRKPRGCETPFLLEKPAYFEGVRSCSVISDKLNPMLTTIGLLCLASTILNLIFIFKSRPVRYYVKNIKGEEKEVKEEDAKVEEEEEEDEESEGEMENQELLRNTSSKVKKVREGSRSDVVYTAANTEETIH